MISLYNVMGIIRRWKNSIICLRLIFYEIPHKKIWLSWGVLFKGLCVQKDTQTPCWLRPCHKAIQQFFNPFMLWHPTYILGSLIFLLTLMLVVANLVNKKWCKKDKKWLKPWHMGNHLRVLSEYFPMNTNMAGFRRFSKIFASLYFRRK